MSNIGNHTSWTTDLTTSLNIWKKLAIFVGILLFILPGVLLYLYWAKMLEPTLVSDGTKLAVYERFGRKASPKTQRFYYNPNAVATVHGYTTKSRNLGLLIISILTILVGLINLLVNSSYIGLIIGVGLFLIFLVFEKKISAVAINSEPNDGVNAGGGLSFIKVFFFGIYSLIVQEEDEEVDLVKSVNETSLRQSGNVEIGGNSTLVFSGVDENARQATLEMETNFDRYL